MKHSDWLRLQSEGDSICANLREQGYQCRKQTRRLSWKLSNVCAKFGQNAGINFGMSKRQATQPSGSESWSIGSSDRILPMNFADFTPNMTPWYVKRPLP